MDKISLKAPAKINLYLRVLGKREDGYHDIESLMQAIDLYDEIDLERSDVVELECDDPSLPADAGNLALKAAVLMQERAYFPGVKIKLRKRIPVGSGLGGGSSDAAFVIRGLCQLYNIDFPVKEKMEMAVEIGSDVPFFLSSGQAIIAGRGEKVLSVRAPIDYNVVVIVPPVMSSTAEIYGKLKISLTTDRQPILLKRRIESSSFYRLLKSFRNDLEEAVLSDLPELEKLREYLSRSGCYYSSVTGSGSAIYGIFRSISPDNFDFERGIGQGCRVFYCRPILLPPL